MSEFFGRFDLHSGFTIGTASNRVHILRAVNTGYILYLFGEVILPSGELLDQENFESQFLPSFQKNTDAFLTNCEGSFVFALYDKQSNEVNLISDPFGNLAVHYYRKNNLISFSINSKQIADEAGAVINEQAILEYLAFGYALSGKTLYKGIHRLPVASHLCFNADGLSIKRYFTPSFRLLPKGEYPEILRSIKELLLQNIEICSREEHVRSGLSGGFDSRINLAAFAYLGRTNVELFTLGLPESGDMIIAKRLSAVLGFRHTVFEFDDEFISKLHNFWELTLSLSQGSMSIESSPQFAVWETSSMQAIRQLDGHGGAIYRRQVMKAQIHAAKNYPSLAEFVFERMKSPLMRSEILSQDIRSAAKEQTLRSLEEYFGAMADHETAGDKIDRLYIEQISGNRYSLAGNAQMKYTQVSHPLLSARIWEHLSHLGNRFRSSNAVYQYLIRSLCPALEKIPLDNSGFVVPYRGYNWRRYIPQIFERYGVNNIAKVSKSLGQKLSLQRSPYTLPMIVSSSPDRVREIALSDSPNFDRYFTKQAIESLGISDPKMVAVANAKLFISSL